MAYYSAILAVAVMACAHSTASPDVSPARPVLASPGEPSAEQAEFAELIGEAHKDVWDTSVVHVTQNRGDLPVELRVVDPKNPDLHSLVCEAPCTANVRSGKYFFGSSLRLAEGTVYLRTAVDEYGRHFEYARAVPYGYHRTKFFQIQGAREYDLTVTPRFSRRAKVQAVLVGVLLPLAAVVPLTVPFVVDMPMKQATIWWAGAGVLAGAGLAGGLTLWFSRSKVEIAYKPLL